MIEGLLGIRSYSSDAVSVSLSILQAKGSVQLESEESSRIPPTHTTHFALPQRVLGASLKKAYL
jgi:hypothetical protein